MAPLGTAEHDAPTATGSGGADRQEQCRFLAAEVLAALARIDDSAVAPSVAESVSRARNAGKALVRLLDGRGDGSADAAPAEPATPSEDDDLIGYHLLVAVADPSARRTIGSALQRQGARLSLARDAGEAEELMAGLAFDLAVIGSDLPDAATAETLALLSDIRVGGAPPVPILALADPGQDAALRQAGAQAVLELPPEPFVGIDRTLTAAVRAVLARGGSVLQDDGRFRRLLEIAGPTGSAELLDRLQEDLQQVEDGLTKALQRADKTELRNTTHVLIALAGAVGATELQRHAEDLNRAAHDAAPLQAGLAGAQALNRLQRLIAFIAREARDKPH